MSMQLCIPYMQPNVENNEVKIINIRSTRNSTKRLDALTAPPHS